MNRLGGWMINMGGGTCAPNPSIFPSNLFGLAIAAALAGSLIQVACEARILLQISGLYLRLARYTGYTLDSRAGTCTANPSICPSNLFGFAIAALAGSLFHSSVQIPSTFGCPVHAPFIHNMMALHGTLRVQVGHFNCPMCHTIQNSLVQNKSWGRSKTERRISRRSDQTENQY
jgi:hypothetical protein